MRYVIISLVFTCVFVKSVNAQMDSLRIKHIISDSTLTIHLNKCYVESKIPKLLIDWLEVDREAIKIFDIKKNQIKKVVIEDGVGNVKTKLIIIINDTILVSPKEKKEKLSNLSKSSIKFINFLNSEVAIKLYGRKGRNGAIVVETY